MITEIRIEQWDCILVEAPSVELIPNFNRIVTKFDFFGYSLKNLGYIFTLSKFL